MLIPMVPFVRIQVLIGFLLVLGRVIVQILKWCNFTSLFSCWQCTKGKVGISYFFLKNQSYLNYLETTVNAHVSSSCIKRQNLTICGRPICIYLAGSLNFDSLSICRGQMVPLFWQHYHTIPHTVYLSVLF